MTKEVVREKMVGSAPEAEPEKAASEQPRRYKVTLAERGPRLPVGFNVGGALVGELKSRPWKTKDERELSKLKKPKMSMAAYISAVVGTMFSKFGPHGWTSETKLDERKVAIGQAYMGDVFYAYMYLRSQVIGNELKMNITCPTPGCGSFAFKGDIGSTEVHCVDDAAALDWFYELRDPIELRKQEVKKLRLRSPLWHTLVSTSANEMTIALGKIMVVQGSIVGLNDDPTLIGLTDSEIDELSKLDLETLATKANDEYIGPKMAVEGNCPKCEREFTAPIDWSYDSFFTTSSL